MRKPLFKISHRKTSTKKKRVEPLDAKERERVPPPKKPKGKKR